MQCAQTLVPMYTYYIFIDISIYVCVYAPTCLKVPTSLLISAKVCRSLTVQAAAPPAETPAVPTEAKDDSEAARRLSCFFGVPRFPGCSHEVSVGSILGHLLRVSVLK